MIVEQRSYTIKIGTAPQFWALYEQYGLKIQRSILGNLIGHYVTDVGELNIIVHMWAYENYADREQRREKLSAEADWKTYLAKSREAGFIIKQENCILKAAPFFDPILKTMLAAAPKP